MHNPATLLDYQLVTPPADLAGYVKFYWRLRALPNNGDHFIFRTMANGCPVMFFYLAGDVRESRVDGYTSTEFYSGVYGATEKTGRFRLSADFEIFGACFYPFAVPLLLGVPSNSITDVVVGLNELMGEEVKNLQDELIRSKSITQQSDSLSTFIRSKIQPADLETSRLSRAVTQVINSRGRINVPAMADDYCLSRRTFERRFKELAGFSPKTYSNVIRFQSAFHELASCNSSLTEIALQCGYYDQPHFTNDFTRFSGFNPKSFTTTDPESNPIWMDFVAFFQFLSWCPPVLCLK